MSDAIEYCTVHDQPMPWCKDQDKCREIMTGWGLYQGPEELRRRAAEDLAALTARVEPGPLTRASERTGQAARPAASGVAPAVCHGEAEPGDPAANDTGGMPGSALPARMSASPFTVCTMSDLPLTRPAPWEELPPEDVVFPLPEPGAARPTEVMVWRDNRVVMHIVAADEDAERAVQLAFREGRKIPGYELTVKAF